MICFNGKRSVMICCSLTVSVDFVGLAVVLLQKSNFADFVWYPYNGFIFVVLPYDMIFPTYEGYQILILSAVVLISFSFPKRDVDFVLPPHTATLTSPTFQSSYDVCPCLPGTYDGSAMLRSPLNLVLPWLRLVATRHYGQHGLTVVLSYVRWSRA